MTDKDAEELIRVSVMPTLRDWLAMHATEEDLRKFLLEGCWFQPTREQARYAYADAMLEARKVRRD